MDTWGAIADLTGCVVVSALFVVLAWAATERGRINRMAARRLGLRRDATALLTRRSIDAGTPSGRSDVRAVIVSIPDTPKGDLQ